MISLGKTRAALVLGALIVASGCSDDSVAPPPKAASLKVVGQTAITAAPNLPALAPVRVQLVDAKDGGIPSRLVVFTVTSGARLSADSVYTDESGVATVGVTAGPAGTYTVTASSEGVAPVTVTLTATTSPQFFRLISGNDQSGLAQEPLNPYTVQVLSNAGTGQPGVTVNFAVTGGGGTLSSGSAVTDADGIARVVHTLGPGGPQTVTATVPVLPAAAPLTFSASITPPCGAARPMLVPQTKNRSLDAVDCQNPQNRYIEYHSFTTTGAQSAVLVTQSSSAFSPSLTLHRVGGADTLAVEGPLTGDATFRVFAPAGTWWIGASSQLPATTGAFTLTTAASTATNDNCPTAPIYVIPGTPTAKATINGNIASTDCVFSGDATQKADQYFVYLRAGQVLRVELQAVPLSDASIDMWIRVRNMTTGAFNNTDCCAGGTVESRTHTAATTGVYRFEAGVYYDPGAPTPQTGPYRMDFWFP